MAKKLSLREYMKERLDSQDKVLAKIIKKIDPLIVNQAKTEGAVGTLKWVIGVGLAGLTIVITLIQLLTKNII